MARMCAWVRREIRQGICRLVGIDSRLADHEASPLQTMPPLYPRPWSYYAYLGNDRGIVMLYDGAHILIDTRDVSVASSLIFNRCWEPSVETALLRLARRGAVAVDLGANFGYYTLSLARAVGPSGKVYAFEANPHLVELLSVTLRINGLLDRATVINAAIIDREATVELHVDPRFCGGGHLSFGPEESELDHYAVRGMTLCQALPDIGRIDLLRMDIEGAEQLALRGAEALIRNSPDLVIVSEWSMPMLVAHGGDVRDFLGWLTALEFSFWEIMRDATLRPVPVQDMLALGHCDVVICRQDPRRLHGR